MSKPCRHKIKFKTATKAKDFAQTYMENIALTFYPMVAFYCFRHGCYHVGHDKYAGGVDKNLQL